MPNNPPTPNPVPAARALRARFQADWRRPRYHFVSPEGSCHPFDPNGALWWRGRCHLFYIVQVEGLGHCWGHASTVDLLHWRIHPLALVPGQGDEGIFSGCALLDKNGVPTIVYLGVRTGICLARSADDELIHWAKDPANPVIPIPEEGSPEAAQYIVHDPHAWLEGDRYYVLTNGRRSLGGREGDTSYLFRSPDLLHWEYLHPFYEPNPAWTGPEEDCACPDFFALGDRHVLLCISHYAGARAYVGRYANQRFLPERHVRMNWPGGTMFAPESLVDPRSGRRIFWGWVCPGRTRAAIDRAGWSGVMSLPRVLSLDEAGELRVEPAAEVERLRLDRVHAEGIDLMPGQDWPVEGLCDWAWEIELEVDADQLAAVDELALRVCCAPDGSEGTRIVYSPSAGTLSIDATRASLSPEVFWPWPHPHRLEGPMPEERVQRAPLALDPGEPLHLRVYLDGSILEVYANGRVCVTQRIYPTRSDSTGVALACAGGPLRVRRLRGWDMAATVAW